MLDHQSTQQEQKQWHGEQAELAAKAFTEFQLEFPSEEKCFDFLTRAIGVVPRWCKKCQTNNEKGIDGLSWFKCRTCRKNTWSTASPDHGRFYRHIKNPRYWAFALYLKMLRIYANPHIFQRLVDCSYSTARNIFKKLEIVVFNSLKQDDANTMLVDVRHFEKIITRRSIHTPPNSHPKTELLYFEEPETSDDPGSGAPAEAALEDTVRAVYEFIKETPITDEQIIEQSGLPVSQVSAGIVMLEIAGLITRVSYCQVQRTPKSSLTAVPEVDAAVVTRLIQFVKSVWSGTSCKMLQLAEAERWRLSDRQRWGGNALLVACANHDPIKDSDVRDFALRSHILVFREPGAKTPEKAA